MAVMVGGFATVAGGVVLAFVGMLSGYVPNIAGHRRCSVMSAPAALVMAKIMVPKPKHRQRTRTHRFTMRARRSMSSTLLRGAGDGLKLLNVGAMLIAFVALVALIALFAWLGGFFGFPALSMGVDSRQSPRAACGVMGVVDWSDAAFCGAQLGVKTVTNEFVAF